MVLLPFPMGCGGKPCCLSSPSQPSGHARQYLVHHKPRALGINVEDGIAQDSWLLPSALAVFCTTCSGHGSWDLSSVSHYQKKPWHRRKGWGISPKNNEKDKNSTGREDKKHLKFKLPRMSFSTITSVLTPGLVLGEHLAPWAGFLQNLWFSGEGRQLPVPSVEILFWGWGHLGCFRQKLPPCCYQLFTTNSFLLKLAQPPVPNKQNQICFFKT